MVDSVSVTGSAVKAGYGATTDDRTAFTAAAEISVGDSLTVDVELLSESDSTATFEFLINAPPGISLSISGGDNASEVVRVGMGT